MKITISNPFHGVECSVMSDLGESLSRSQMHRVRKALCGVSGCSCFGRKLKAWVKTCNGFEPLWVRVSAAKDSQGNFETLTIG